MLKVSAFYLEKQKSFIPKKKCFFGHCQYENKRALFTDLIFREGFGCYCLSQVVTQGISYLDVKKYTGLKAALRTETKKVALLASRRHKESADTNPLMPDRPVPRYS